MFEEARLFGQTEKSIRLQTRRGWDIPNLIELEPGVRERQLYQLLCERFGRDWTQRKPASGGYNCAGHVWASRRTSILEEPAWFRILEDDGYRCLGVGETPCPGDLALYRDRGPGGCLHVGEVVRLKKGVAEGSPDVPWVMSKWNSTSGEVLHGVHDVAHLRGYYDVQIEFWTDRPAPSI